MPRLVKTPSEIAKIAAAGKILAAVMREVAGLVRPGVSLSLLDDAAYRLITEAGAKPAFLGYRPSGSARAYPASICASLNDVVVHGVPSGRILREGDVLKLDFGLKRGGFFTDAALTVGVGKISAEAARLIKVTKEALELAIKECRPGKTLGDIGFVIDAHAKKNGFKTVRELTGHGVGLELHEDPVVPNRGKRGEGLRLEEGMVLAIEPMLSAGSEEIIQTEDDAYATADGAPSAHFEHTVAITPAGPLVCTKE